MVCLIPCIWSTVCTCMYIHVMYCIVHTYVYRHCALHFLMYCRMYFGEHNVKGMFSVLEPLHLKMERGPETLKEISFNHVRLHVLCVHVWGCDSCDGVEIVRVWWVESALCPHWLGRGLWVGVVWGWECEGGRVWCVQAYRRNLAEAYEWGNVRVWWCEDVMMWGCEDVRVWYVQAYRRDLAEAYEWGNVRM